MSWFDFIVVFSFIGMLFWDGSERDERLRAIEQRLKSLEEKP